MGFLTPPTTVTITAADTTALLVDGSGLHRQPPGPQALITLRHRGSLTGLAAPEVESVQ